MQNTNQAAHQRVVAAHDAAIRASIELADLAVLHGIDSSDLLAEVDAVAAKLGALRDQTLAALVADQEG